MKIVCAACAFEGEIADDKIPSGGTNIICPKCKNKFPVSRPDEFRIEPDEAPAGRAHHSGVDSSGRPLRSKVAAGILGILVGGFGIHRFYLGYVNIGIIQIIVTICTCGIGGLWGFIEGILILVDEIDHDYEGRPLRD